MKSILSIVAGCIMLAMCIACMKYSAGYRRHYDSLNSLLYVNNKENLTLYLKVHLADGGVCVLNAPWEVDTSAQIVSGYGSSYNARREIISTGEHILHQDSIALLETNSDLAYMRKTQLAGLVIVTVFNVAMLAYCLSNPKACYGSCPTFYTEEEQSTLHYALAEGFSNAILPSMAYADIDALRCGQLTSDTFSLIMKNEAFETHSINALQLFCFPRKTGERVLHTPDDRFYLADHFYPVTSAIHEDHQISDLLAYEDHAEWFSLADPQNMSSKESIILNFGDTKDQITAGLVVSFRQTLMTTYLFYSAMDYMGDRASDLFASMERDPDLRAQLYTGLLAELGRIDVYIRSNASAPWELVGGFHETGPIAFNLQCLPLPGTWGPESAIKLELNKGLWRLDYVALAQLTEAMHPTILHPFRVSYGDSESVDALRLLLSPHDDLITLPGDTYTIRFALPQHQDIDLFLYARGYYLEWMRGEWLKDKDLLKLRQMVRYPKTYLRQQAQDYKIYEHTMEHTFWNSRVTSNPFEYEQ